MRRKSSASANLACSMRQPCSNAARARNGGPSGFWAIGDESNSELPDTRDIRVGWVPEYSPAPPARRGRARPGTTTVEGGGTGCTRRAWAMSDAETREGAAGWGTLSTQVRGSVRPVPGGVGGRYGEHVGDFERDVVHEPLCL